MKSNDKPRWGLPEVRSKFWIQTRSGHEQKISGRRSIDRFVVREYCFLVARRAPAADHLRKQECALKDRARGESPRESAEKLARAFVVVEPPKVRNEWKSIDVN